MRWIDAVKLFVLGCLLGAAVGANARGQDDATRFAGELNAVRAARGRRRCTRHHGGYPDSHISVQSDFNLTGGSKKWL